MTRAEALGNGLLARTRELADPGDLLDWLGPEGFAWLHEGAGFVTAGTVLDVPTDRATSVLASVQVDDEVGVPGTGALAVGALPFAGPGVLVVPALVVGRAPDGRAWVTEVAPAGGHPVAPVRFAAHREPSTVRVIGGSHDPGSWAVMVKAALARIDDGELAKVVLARQIVLEADRPFDRRLVLEHLRDRQAGCYVYGAPGLAGASPELLVRREGRRVSSQPMAGTVARGATAADDDAAVEALSTSAKDALEHRLLVDAVAEVLAARCTRVDAPAEPEVVRLADVAHLATTVHGNLREPRPSALDLALALHPTPAVGGSPRDAALAVIAELEGFGRGRYAGPVGWVDGRGDGEWAVALRGAELEGSRAVVRAGAGIVAGSDPEAEWAETEAKLAPVLDALGVRR